MIKLTTPVAFFTFNRIDTTKQVFEAIRRAKPPKLYLVSDGPRDHVAGEKEKVAAVRDYMESHVDWDCQVFKNYADRNMGCGKRVSSGISWVFEQEEEAIILEDDCLPDDTFFLYCQEMLEYYREDERIMIIGGSNSAASDYHTKEEYLFTKIPLIWGWASWRRAWELYDYDIKTWPEQKKKKAFRKLMPLKAYWVYEAEFDALYRHSYDTWDYQLYYAVMLHDKLNIAPRVSYTKNIGFQGEATHTTGAQNITAVEAGRCTFPIRHRAEVIWDEEFDRFYLERKGKHGFTAKIKSMLGLDINKPIWEKKK